METMITTGRDCGAAEWIKSRTQNLIQADTNTLHTGLILSVLNILFLGYITSASGYMKLRKNITSSFCFLIHNGSLQNFVSSYSHLIKHSHGTFALEKSFSFSK